MVRKLEIKKFNFLGVFDHWHTRKVRKSEFSFLLDDADFKRIEYSRYFVHNKRHLQLFNAFNGVLIFWILFKKVFKKRSLRRKREVCHNVLIWIVISNYGIIKLRKSPQRFSWFAELSPNLKNSNCKVLSPWWHELKEN